MISAAAMGTNYYTAPNAKGDGRSLETPGKLTEMIKLLQPGDSLLMRGGQYDLSETVVIKCSGDEDNRIYIGRYQHEKPILDFRNQPGQRDFNGVNCKGDYLHFYGLTIRYAGFKGFYSIGARNIIEGLDVYGCCDTGIQHKGGTENYIINCDSHDNFDYVTGGLTAADYGGNADGFGDKQYSTIGSGNYYIGCRAWNNSDDGWDFYQRNGKTQITNCISFHNGPYVTNMNEFMKTNPRGTCGDKAWFAQFANGKEVEIVNADGMKVKCSMAKYFNTGNGNGFKLGGDNKKHYCTLHRCLAVDNGVKGFDQNNNASNMYIYNCTAYKNQVHDFGFSNARNGRYLDIKNSVSVSNNVKINDNEDDSSDSWSANFQISEKDFQSTDMAALTAERDADFNLPKSKFLQLTPTSILRNAGESLIGITYKGTAPDLGCYEYEDE